MTKQRAITLSDSREMLVICLCALAMNMGCDNPTSGDSNNRTSTTEVAQQELAAFPGVVLWPPNINLCFSFEPLPNGSFPIDETEAMDSVLSALNDSWAAASSLQFTNTGTCPGTIPNGTMRLKLQAAVEGAGMCGAGLGSSCNIGVAGDTASIKSVAVHEVGHSLGLGHEHQRSIGGALEQPLCFCEEVRRSQAEQVVAANQPMTFPATNCWAQVTLDVATARQWLADRQPQALNALTAFDTESVMNYCSTRGPKFILSEKDRLGVEMLYPIDMSGRAIHPIGPGAFITQTGLVVRSDTQISLATDWTARGAPLSFQVSTTWRKDGSYAASDPIYSRLYAEGTAQMSIEFSDPFTAKNPGRIHRGSTSITASNSLYTAILIAAAGN
ncbi:MAG: hypothetical protein ACOZQL_20125 [Myxococcota bacterium]